jgi:flagellar M-ring protein FliF
MAEPRQVGTELARTGVAGDNPAGFAAYAGKARSWFTAMHPARRSQLIAAVLLIGATIAALGWYANRPDWRLLYSGLESKDVQQVAQELSAANILYQMTEDGSGIQVSADQIDRARMEVATKGMPQTGRMGFELFDKPNWVGSEFDEKVNYQRALEGELEHTISTLAAVRSARVHLVLPKDSEFGDTPQQAKASVVLQLRRSAMPPEQIEAIRGLVAGAVENLSPGDVTLVDADGHLNLAAPSPDHAGGDEERTLEDKLVAMLEPMTGAGNLRASVNIAYDEGSEEKTDEVYDPAQVAALTMHRTEQTSGDAKQHAAGIPGTASNTPGAVPAAATPAQGKGSATPPLLQTASTPTSPGAAQNTLPVYPQGATPAGETVTDENGTYAVTRHLSHLQEGPGRIRRVTAAIVVNDLLTTEGSGKLAHTVWKPRTADEMQRFQQLARDAVGFDATRGDEITVQNIGFSSNQPEAAPTAMSKAMDEAGSVLNAQPGLLKTLSFSLVALLVVFVVLKPVSRQITTALKQAPAASLPASTSDDARFAQPGAALGALPSGLPHSDTQALYRQIAEQVRKEPAQSARVVESWINARTEDLR